MTTHAAMYVNAIIDDAGNALANVSFTVTDPTSNASVPLYSDSDKTPLVGSPHTDTDGNATVFCDASQGPIKITVPLTGKSITVPPIIDGRDLASIGEAIGSGVVIGSNDWLIQIVTAEAFVAWGSTTRDSNGALLTANVTWPDGISGTYVGDTVSSAFPGFVDAWHFTYAATTPKTITQPLVTRGPGGEITVRPQLIVS